MNERLKYLEEQEQTEEIKNRIDEITLCIVRVQQILLAEIGKKKTGIWGQDIDECNKFFKSITKNAGPRDE